MWRTVHLVVHDDSRLRDHQFAAEEEVDGRDFGNGEAGVVHGCNVRRARSRRVSDEPVAVGGGRHLRVETLQSIGVVSRRILSPGIRDLAMDLLDRGVGQHLLLVLI